MDIVYIHDLEIETVIGIYDWERERRQVVRLDLEMATDIRPAARDDDIRLALDYKQVAKRVIAFVEGSEYFLVETLAEEIARLVRTEFQVPWMRLRVGKPGAVTGSREVGVVIERGDRSAGADART
ncbi:MAG: dihydroneopterin aldolase [Gammaproteobacteria bacterium]|nr:dihydroneopterin aldolase [Pseudomonadales bacterium]MCP5347126.1 dihydroneopterin aldolase [Pseudomonadales bacterium]